MLGLVPINLPPVFRKREPRMKTRRGTHHRVLGIAVPGLTGFEQPGLTCVAVKDLEQASDLVVHIPFDLLLVGSACMGQGLEQLLRSLRTTRNSPRWVVVSDDDVVEIRARALGAVAMVSSLHDPRLMLVLESINVRPTSA
jgi:DNA-binding NarL/FixJ family response regulator